MSVTRSPGTVGLPQVHSDNVSRASGYDFFNTPPPTHTHYCPQHPHSCRVWLCWGLSSQAACGGPGTVVNVLLAPLATAKTLLIAKDMLRETALVSFAMKVKG